MQVETFELFGNSSAIIKSTVSKPKRQINEFLTFTYDLRILFLGFLIVTFSVFGVMVMLIPTEKMTPATVKRVDSTDSGTLKDVVTVRSTATGIANTRYINGFSMSSSHFLYHLLIYRLF